MKDTARRRRRAKIFLPAAALTVSLPFIALSPAGASVLSAGSAGTKAKPAESRQARIEANQEVLDKIAGEITEGLSDSDRARIPGFTDIEVDPDHNRLRLHWKGTPPPRVRRILAHLPHGVTAEVHSARYSKAELHAARAKLLRGNRPMSLRIAAAAAPIRITSIGPAVDGSGLQIGYDQDRGNGRQNVADAVAGPAEAVAADASKQVEAVAARLTGVRTAAVRRLPAEDLASRQHDGSPWAGGAALKNPGGGICSSSFAVRNARGDYLMTTAYHCDGHGGRWSTWWGGDLVGTTDPSEKSGPDDALGIRLPSKRSRGYLYDGPASETNGYAKPVVGWGHNNVGDYVCSDGANSGVHCGLQITSTDIGVTGQNGIYRPDADLAYATSATPGGAAAVNGDSGGPVFASVRNHTADEARGVITALDRTITCPASLNPNTVLDGHRRTPWCLAGVYYVPISQTLHDMHWTLVTR